MNKSKRRTHNAGKLKQAKEMAHQDPTTYREKFSIRAMAVSAQVPHFRLQISLMIAARTRITYGGKRRNDFEHSNHARCSRHFKAGKNYGVHALIGERQTNRAEMNVCHASPLVLLDAWAIRM